MRRSRCNVETPCFLIDPGGDFIRAAARTWYDRLFVDYSARRGQLAQVFRVSGTVLTTPGPRLVAELRSRSPAAWAEVYNAYHDHLYRYTVTRVRSAEEASDIVAIVFVRALDAIKSYREHGKPLVAWLYGITQNVIREKHREFARAERKTAFSLPWFREREHPDLSTGDLGVPERLDLHAAIEQLTPDQREVVRLVHFGGFRVKEVAAMLGKGERAVYYLEARALLRLRDVLGEDGMGGCP